jgi:hypothetical protein
MEMRLTITSIEIIQSLMICGLDSEEIREWLLMKNPVLGYRTPLYLINRGRAERVLQMTLEAEEDPHRLLFENLKEMKT